MTPTPSTSHPEPRSALHAAVDVTARLRAECSALQGTSDGELVTAAALVAVARRHLEAYAGAVAAEIARRSRREFGHAGLAQREGFRTPEAMIQQVTGSTRADAVALVKVGTMVAAAEVADTEVAEAADGAGARTDPTDSGGYGGDVAPDPMESPGGDSTDPPWHAGLSARVREGRVSFAMADAIRAGLGEPTAAVSAESLRDAVESLLAEAMDPHAPATAEQLRRLARQMRESLDVALLAALEEEQRDAQYLRLWSRNDGMVAGSLLLDRENGAYLRAVVDRITSPRRGGPRFVSAEERERATRVTDDRRSTDRIAVESILELVRIGADADPGRVLGTREPGVRVVVTREALDGEMVESGFIQSTGERLSIATVERRVCETGAMTVTVTPSGVPLDVGREQRLFTRRQREALAVRDGGCRFPGCERPPSWCEAHHVRHWHDDGGSTDVADGILLCRHHHLLLHNNGWRILRDGDQYALRPPRSRDPEQAPIPLRGRSPLPHRRRAAAHPPVGREHPLGPAAVVHAR